MSELEAFVEDVETEPTVDETADIPEAEAAPDEGEMESTTQTGETEEVPPTSEQEPQETHEPQMVPLAAKQAEKDRRIAAERELEALRQQVYQKQEVPERPDIFDNPDAVLSNLEVKMRAEFSEAMARREFKDYDEVMDHYTEMVKKNPSLHAEVMQNPLSAYKAYEVAKSDIEIKAIGDPATYKQKLEAEIRAQVEAELKAQRTSVPPDLTTARSTGGDPKANVIADGNDGLEQLLAR